MNSVLIIDDDKELCALMKKCVHCWNRQRVGIPDRLIGKMKKWAADE